MIDEATLKGNHILITGGAGFVGSNLTRLLLTSVSDIRITIVDNFLSAEKCNVPDDVRVQLIEGSIADDSVLDKLEDEFDYVFHLSTYHGNQSSIHDPLADHEHNTLTTLKLFERIKDFQRIRKVVYAAAGCAVAKKTFEQAHACEEVEEISLDADSPYSISKAIGEFYSKYYHKQHGLPTVRARFQNVYGPGEILGAGEWRGTEATIWRNVVPAFIYRALNGLPLLVDNEGIATRDFIYVEDLVQGLVACALKGTPGGVYNLASGKETSIRELSETVNRMAESSVPIQYQPRRSWDNSGMRYGSTVKAKRELGFSVQVPFAEGMAKTIDWTKANMDLIQTTMHKHASRVPIATLA